MKTRDRRREAVLKELKAEGYALCPEFVTRAMQAAPRGTAINIAEPQVVWTSAALIMTLTAVKDAAQQVIDDLATGVDLSPNAVTVKALEDALQDYLSLGRRNDNGDSST